MQNQIYLSKCLCVGIGDNCSNAFATLFFEQVYSRIPHLTDIEIWSYIPMHAIRTEMISLIASLVNLWTSLFLDLTQSTQQPSSQRLSLVRHTFSVQFILNEIEAAVIPSILGPLFFGHSVTATFHDAACLLRKNLSNANLTCRNYYHRNSPINPFFTLRRFVELLGYPRKNSLLHVDQSPGDLNIDVMRLLFKVSDVQP
jgi:hypothetical protein